jgi:hypothetical protein
MRGGRLFHFLKPAISGAGSSGDHADLTNVTSDQHHAQSHDLASHSSKAHAALTGVGADDHHVAFVTADHDALANPHHSSANDHAAAHTLASHSTKAHSELSGVGADDHHSRAHQIFEPLDHTDSFRSSGVLAETAPRWVSTGNAHTITTATLDLALIYIPAGTVMSNITFQSSTTALSAGLNQWFSLYTLARGLLAVTGDDTTTAWSSSNVKKTLFVARTVTDVVTNGTTTITSATAAFTAADVGKPIFVIGAGVAGAPLGTSLVPVTIASVTNATTAVLSVAATDSASGHTAYIGTPYTVVTAGLYYVGCTVNATVPSLNSIAVNASIAGEVPIMSGTSTATHTTPATAPGTAAAITATANMPRAYIT